MAIYLRQDISLETIMDALTSAESTQRRSNAYYDQQVLDGLQYDQIFQRLQLLYPDNAKFLRVSDIQIVKKIVEKRARAYATPPTRRSPSTNEAETEELNRIYKLGMFDAAFEDFDRTFNYFNYGFLWVTPMRNELGETIFKLRNLRPFEFDMIFDPMTGDPWAFSICYTDNDLSTGISTRFSVWTREMFFEFNCFGYNFINRNTAGLPNRDRVQTGVPQRNEIISGPEINPLQMLPGTYLQYDSSPGFPVRNNLCARSIEWNVAMTDLKTAIAVQGTGIPVFKYDQDIKLPDNALELGKNKYIKLPQPKDKESHSTEFLFVEPKPAIGPALETLRFELQMILEDNGIRGKSIVAPTSVEQFSSGFDRLISEADVQYIINKNQNLYASKLEQNIFGVIKRYQNFMDGTSSFGDTEDIEVFFDKPKVLISDRETLENLSMRLTLGTLLPWEKHIILNPNLTEAEAKEREAQINASGIKEEMNPPKPGMEGEGSANKRPVTNQSQAGANNGGN